MEIESDSVHLHRLIEKMKALLPEPSEKQYLAWAAKVCTASRNIHLNIWKYHLSQKETRDEVIPLLQIAASQIQAEVDSRKFVESDSRKIQLYQKNIEERLHNLRNNYLAGRKSAFPTGNQLNGPRRGKLETGTQSKRSSKEIVTVLKIDVEFYNDTHKELLKANCSAYSQIEALVKAGLQIEKEELFSCAMFVEQKPGVAGWETYNDLQRELPNFRRAWERNFDFSRGTIHANFERLQIRICYKEAMGVGGALALVSRVYGFTEADWETIPISQVRDLDFKIASTGTQFIEVEAKSSVVPDHGKTHISSHKGDIEAKKYEQRNNQQNTANLLGAIVSIPSDKKLRAKCLVLDPLGEDMLYDPFKYKLLSRLYFYWRELSMLSRAHFLEVLVNKIKDIQASEDCKSLDGLPLLNRRGKPHQLPDSLFEKRSCLLERSAFGEVLPLGDGRFFFYGFDTEVVEALIQQDFSRLNALSFESRTESDIRVSAKIPRRLLGGPKTEVKYDEDREEDESRKRFSMIGDLVHTSSGRVLGSVKPVSR